MEYMSNNIEFIKDLKEHIGTLSLKDVCVLLKNYNNKYNWVGIYILKEQKLVLECYVGEKTEHEVISLDSGLCSLAIVKNKIINEPDVKSNPEYLSCFASTKSELVLPIHKNGKAIGEIDIDSDTKNAFSKADEEFMSKVAEIIAHKISK
jgi:GAF domain-containing protein